MKAISRRGPRGGRRSSIATAPISTRSSARSAPATSASTRCTSTCTRPSRPRTAAAGRARARWCCRKRSRRSRRCRSSAQDGRRHVRAGRGRDMPATTIPRRFGRMVAFHGQMGMFTRALAYILSHGADGLQQVAEDAVLNANYILRSLEDVLDAPFASSGPCMHEAMFSDKGFAGGPQHDRPRQGADRRGLPPDDHVFPAGRPRRDAGRADRDRIEGGPRPVHRCACVDRASGRRRATRASRPRRSSRRGGGSTRRWRRGSRCWCTSEPVAGTKRRSKARARRGMTCAGADGAVAARHHRVRSRARSMSKAASAQALTCGRPASCGMASVLGIGRRAAGD